MCYKDRSFCSADCVNSLCERNKVHTQGADDFPVCFSDFSQTCNEQERPEEVGKTLQLSQAMFKAQEHMNGFNEQTKQFYSLGIEVANRFPELKNKNLTRVEDEGFRRLLKDLGLNESMVNWKIRKA